MISLECANCGLQLETPVVAPPVTMQCPLCLKETELEFFPALLREIPRGTAGETLLVDSESSCFYHENKKAVVVCEHCGRFLCSLCDVDIDGRHVCPGCVESVDEKSGPAPLPQEAPCYDDLALSVAVYPVLVFYLIPITAPIALYLVIRNWRRFDPPVPRTRWKFVVAALVAVCELALTATIILGLAL